MKSSLAVLSLVIIAALLAASFYFYSRHQSMAVELAKLRYEVEEVSRLRAENEKLRTSAPPSQELEQLRKDVAEVYKFRNEVGQLRKEKQGFTQQLQQTQLTQANLSAPPAGSPDEELQRLRAENAQLHQENEQFHQTRVQGQSNRCIANLKQLDGAKEQWALENRKRPEDIPTWEDLIGPDRYIRNMTVCPNAGQYLLNALSQPPTCSIPGHQLPQ